MVSNKEKYTMLDLHNLKNEKVVCLTLDVEQDHADLLDEPSYDGFEHIPNLVSFFKERDIPLTCFVQGSLLETHPAQIEQLYTLDVEFELHSYSHPGPQEMNTEFEIEKGKEAYRRFFSEDPLGYRAPLGVINGSDYEILASNGFRFDSSIYPSIRPGTFNNLTKPTKPYILNNSQIVEFPIAVLSDIIRVPVSLSYIKLLGKPYLRLLKTFNLPSLIIFDFHLHDLFQLNSSNKIPLKKFPFIYQKIFKRIYHQGSINGLYVVNELIMMLKKRGYTFSKLIDIYDLILKQPYRGKAYEPNEIS